MSFHFLPKLNQDNLRVFFTAPLLKDTDVQFNLYPKSCDISFPHMKLVFFGLAFVWPENANKDYVYNISITDGIQMIEFVGCSIDAMHPGIRENTIDIHLGQVVENMTTMTPRVARTYTEITFPHVAISVE